MKGLAYDGEKFSICAAAISTARNNHVVPTLVHDGKVIIESTLIIEYLDEAFAAPPLMPTDPTAARSPGCG